MIAETLNTLAAMTVLLFIASKIRAANTHKNNNDVMRVAFNTSGFLTVTSFLDQI